MVISYYHWDFMKADHIVIISVTSQTRIVRAGEKAVNKKSNSE